MADIAPLDVSAPPAPSVAERLIAADVARGVCRMLLRHDIVAIGEMPLDGGRRADLMAVGPKGELVIVEIKVSRADLLGDGKWTDYLPHCDRFFWAIPTGFDAGPLDTPAFLPERSGVIVADRYDAAIVREAATVAMPVAARRRCTLALARRAARRVIGLVDPDAFAGFPRG
ncbi:MmcB family DNA repair protein [Sphingomonas donggukensis]|uniref:MmcB family DNA repair protein n=1 Tax=Sphingomonas donggukensis TaxID=2949093 RepID=A0ABY4TS68_9SPHN|nr:MmcB family DNA repair protein [Sphingomonas donggukensis]URW75263.1 MmcB family DNA repair protein [Sphingomonas donggukensis]